MAAEHLTKGRGVFLLFIIAIGVGVIGWGSPASSSLPCDGTFHAGFGRCEQNTVGCSLGLGITCGTGTIVFPTRFTNVPALSDFTITQPNPSVGTTTISQPQSYATWSFLHVESAGQTWTNMPAPQTEFFGDALGQHRLTVDWGNMTQVDFLVVCSVGSANANAVLDVQYSVDGEVTWTTIPGITVGVSNTVCGLGIPLDWGVENGTCPATVPLGTACYKPIPAAAQKEGVALRIVGTSGNGVGDLPVFQQAYLITHTQSLASVVLGQACQPSVSSITATGFILKLFCVFVGGSETVGWKVSVATG